jgi:hypothetical protein
MDEASDDSEEDDDGTDSEPAKITVGCMRRRTSGVAAAMSKISAPA